MLVMLLFFGVVVAVDGIVVDVGVIIAYALVFAKDDDDVVVFYVATTDVAVVDDATIVTSSPLAYDVSC